MARTSSDAVSGIPEEEEKRMRRMLASALSLSLVKKSLIGVAISLPAIAGVATPASAAPPERQTITGTYENDVIAACDGFDVLRNGTFTVVRTTFFGADGEPVRVQIHVTRNAVVANSVTGKTARDDAVWTLVFDLAGGTLSGSGKFENVTVPGHGSARYDIGHFVESTEGESFAGSGRTSAGDEALCAALA
jgi:hypothetical protein